MAATADLINATDATITGWGGSAVNVTARTVAVAQTLTDAQQAAGYQAVGTACMKPSSTAASKAQVASALLDDILTDSRIDLSTPKKRKLFRLKAGLEELELILEKIAPDTAI